MIAEARTAKGGTALLLLIHSLGSGKAFYPNIVETACTSLGGGTNRVSTYCGDRLNLPDLASPTIVLLACSLMYFECCNYLNYLILCLIWVYKGKYRDFSDMLRLDCRLILYFILVIAPAQEGDAEGKAS